jgi:hypothetical protein
LVDVLIVDSERARRALSGTYFYVGSVFLRKKLLMFVMLVMIVMLSGFTGKFLL